MWSRFSSLSSPQGPHPTETPLEIHLSNKRTYLEQLDKGANRENNDRSFEGRRKFFKVYAQKLGISDPTLKSLTPTEREGLISAFAIDVSTGVNITKLDYIKPSTLKDYLKAAAF
jgi:hypothetical protein